MGIFRDLRRLKKVADQQQRPSLSEALSDAADAAEFWAQAAGAPGAPVGTHGAAAANPFDNLQFYNRGTPAAGTVVSLEPTERQLDGVPIYAVQLDVKIDGREPYRSEYQTVIAAAALANWQPGKVLPFRVSPDDPHSLMLG